MNQKKKVGRPRVGRKRDFRISDSDYKAFKEWCKSRGLRPTQVVRSLILHHYVKAFIEELDVKNLKELS